MDWRDKVLNAQTPKATAKAFKGKKVTEVMKPKKALQKPQPWMPERIKMDSANPPGTMKRAYKGRPS